jgi:hypothetical protein
MDKYKEYNAIIRRKNTTLIATGFGLAISALIAQYILRRMYPPNPNSVSNSSNDPNKANTNNNWLSSFFARNFYDGGAQYIVRILSVAKLNTLFLKVLKRK